MKLLVVDTQKGITDERLYRYDNLVESIKRLISIARENSIEVIFVQHDDGPGSGFSIGDDEFEIYEGFKPWENEKIFIKNVNSAFYKTGLHEYLQEKKENTIIIVGLQTDFCIDATVKSGFEHGYRMIVPEGTNSSFDNKYIDKKTTVDFYNKLMWPNRYADCLSMEETIELMINNK